jgi:hypothetical protein
MSYYKQTVTQKPVKFTKKSAEAYCIGVRDIEAVTENIS